jgi:hypothetical protein
VRAGTGAGAGVLAGLLGLALLAAPLAVLLALAASSEPPPISGGGCRLTGTTSGGAWSHPGTGLELDQEQVTNARIVIGAAHALGLPDRAAVIGLATALQESGLRALTQAQSDRDSAGIFQQRPSMGWGSTGQVMDPVYAAQAFYTHLAGAAAQHRRPGRATLRPPRRLQPLGTRRDPAARRDHRHRPGPGHLHHRPGPGRPLRPPRHRPGLAGRGDGARRAHPPHPVPARPHQVRVR